MEYDDLLRDRVPAYVFQGLVFIGDDGCQSCYAACVLGGGVSSKTRKWISAGFVSRT
jgi:hypothetical protein